jgi:hypothetical protein
VREKYSTREAAKKLGRTILTLQRHIAAGTIKARPLIEVGTVKVRLWSDRDVEKALPPDSAAVSLKSDERSPDAGHAELKRDRATGFGAVQRYHSHFPIGWQSGHSSNCSRPCSGSGRVALVSIPVF